MVAFTSRKGDMNDRGKTVVFIHGLWLHATSVPNWAGLFEQSRSTPLAPGWPGEPATSTGQVGTGSGCGEGHRGSDRSLPTAHRRFGLCADPGGKLAIDVQLDLIPADDYAASSSPVCSR